LAGFSILLDPNTEDTMGQQNDAIGRQGENIAEYALLDGTPKEPIFWPRFLGEKSPKIDFYVEVIGSFSVKPFFLCQVKGTRTAPKNDRLSIKLSKKDKLWLLSLHVPTYLIGVHTPTKKSYIVSIHPEMGKKKGLGSMTTAYPFTTKNRILLKNEVLEFWKAHGKKPLVSHFPIKKA
jgi:hypothetical protein